MRIVGYDQPPLEDVLEHHGVKGMHWGVIRQKLANHSEKHAQQKQLNKDSKARDKAARDAEIEAARQRYNTSSRANYLKAKDQFKKDKLTLGSREAKKKFNSVKQQNIDDYAVASQAKSGRETAISVLAIVGSVAAVSILSAAARRV